MAVSALKNKAARLAMVTTTAGFMVGLAFLNGGTAQSIGGLCNGQPASHTWLDASGQYGPALLDGTDHDDTIIGSATATTRSTPAVAMTWCAVRPATTPSPVVAATTPFAATPGTTTSMVAAGNDTAGRRRWQRHRGRRVGPRLPRGR